MDQVIDPATGLPLTQAIWQQVALSLFGIATIIIGVAGAFIANLARVHLPAWVNAFIDEKRKNDVHQAAVTIARRIILEGGDPRQNLQMGIDYMIESAKDAFARWQTNGRSAGDVKTIFGNILISKIPDVLKELNMGVHMPMPEQPQSGEIVPEDPEVEKPESSLLTGGSSEMASEYRQEAPIPVHDAEPRAKRFHD